MVVQQGLVSGGIGELRGGQPAAQLVAGQVVQGVLVNLALLSANMRLSAV